MTQAHRRERDLEWIAHEFHYSGGSAMAESLQYGTNSERAAVLARLEAHARAERGRGVAGCWKDGECVIAKKVSPDRATLVAEKLAALRLTLKKMEDQLRAAAVTGKLALQPAA